MDYLPKDTLFKLDPDTLDAVRKIYKLDQLGAMNEAVTILADWVQKQNHFVKKDFTRGYLERTIIAQKGSVERAKTQLDKVCTLRTLMPQFFGDYDIRNDFKHLYYDVLIHGFVPKHTKDYYRLFIVRISECFESKNFLEYYKIIIMFAEYYRAHDYSTGHIYVIDFADVNIFEYASKINPIELRQFMTIVTQGYGVRIKGIHILTPSKFVDTLVTILKQVLSEKVSGRIQVHKTLESLHSAVPKELLTSDYGGKEKPLREIHDDWLDVLSMKENRAYQREMNAACTNESLRQIDTFNDQYMGMPGTFRTLRVD